MKPVFEAYPIINGSGPVQFLWQKQSGNYLAVTSANNAVNIFDRRGQVKAKLSLHGPCVCMDWDREGNLLAVLQERSGVTLLWNAHYNTTVELDTGLKDMSTFCCWAEKSATLAIGTLKGNLLLYNHRTKKKIPVIGKHTKRITCGAWSNENLLALGSEDKSITVSNLEGDTLQQIPLRGDPSNVMFARTDQTSRETTISAILGSKTLLLLDIDETDSPVELAFQPRYGNIVSYKWYGDRKIMIGFSQGYYVVVSSKTDQMGQELFQARNHKDLLTDVAVCMAINQGASCGDNSVKIHDLSELKEVYNIISVEEEKGQVDQLGWTPDGQLLTVSTNQGFLLTYLTKLPLLGSSCGTRVAYLSTLLQVTVVNNVEDEAPFRTSIPIEPSILAVGTYHFAVGLNNRAWFYPLGDGDTSMEKSYLGTLTSLSLNGDYAAALFDGKIMLHMIEPGPADMEQDGRQESKLFPEAGSTEVITCAALTNDFLIYATQSGGLHYFYIEEWKTVNEYHHPTGIAAVYPDVTGTRAVFVDEKGDGVLYNPVNDECIDLQNFPHGTKGVLWDNWIPDKHVLVVFDAEKLYTYVYCRDTVEGPLCQMIGATRIPFGQHPLMLCAGEVSCQTLTGKMSILRLATHTYQDEQEMDERELKSSFDKCVALKRFKDAWSLAGAIDEVECWRALGMAALYHLDVELALRAFRMIQDIPMAFSLQKALTIEDRNELAGYIRMVKGDYDLAQDLFMRSSNPLAALEMQCDLRHWEQALQLAKAAAPERVPAISTEYAQQLEVVGDYPGALRHFEEALSSKYSESEDHKEICTAGVARMSIRTGDIHRGVSMAQETESQSVKKDCADILESLKLFAEAGVLYEQAECFDQAAGMFVKTKNWDKVGTLLSKVSAPKYHGLYAKAREADGHYKEAAEAFKRAKDYDNFVRIKLEHLHSPDEAVQIVRETGSVEGAKMIAKYFQRMGDLATALQFLVVSQCNKEAFELAKSQNLLDTYAELVGPEAGKEDFLRLAQHYQSVGNPLEAGRFYLKAKEYAKALHEFIVEYQLNSDEGENIDLAIQTVGEAQKESLTKKLIEYLMGEADDCPKDARYLFQLHMALKQYREAGRTAIIVAREHQNNGNYKHAHDVLFNMYQELRKQDIKIPSEMSQNLMLLHSYSLVKVHVKKGDHLRAARLLLRVANNISKFPSHTVPILTSTVIECQRSGLKNSAFTFAAMLMRTDYRPLIDQKWKKKIEQIVRKPDKSEIEESRQPCPHCEQMLAEMQLDCSECKNTVSYCIASGRHMVREDSTTCPHCLFPAIHSEFSSLLEVTGTCPMCSESIDPSFLKQNGSEDIHTLSQEEIN
jgi:WD repeat-containing protein 19